MAKPNRDNRNRPNERRPGPPTGAPSAQAHRPAIKSRYDAPGDEPMATALRLTLQEPFHIERELVHRLERRDVNVKEAFTLRDASGSYFRASLRDLNPDGGLAVPYERMERSPEPTIDITLACSVLARQRMIFVMQKATELGVTRVVPLLTDHSVPPGGLEHERANSWPAQVVRAAKQCRRASLPAVLPPVTLDAFLESAAFTNADECVMLDDRSDPAPAPAEPPKRVVLFVGPEGGFSDAERARLTGKARPWMLGGRILRAETAVLVGLTAVQMTWGDFVR
ncbi:MAG: Ribosomal small subunit methyltransferase [Phycisphaerales bacterium]|nr:Ribosomal small subunit methyltransferase [Phycisphaerales bacterium]